MREVKRWGIALVALLWVACFPALGRAEHQATPIAAWWVDIHFKATSTTLRGLDVRAIDKNWKYATALDDSLLEGRITDDELKEFRALNGTFSLSADLDGDCVPEDFFVGVYETDEGETGRFLLITRNGQVLQHFWEDGTRNFSVLVQVDRAVRWYKCNECGDYDSVSWGVNAGGGKSFVLD
jgi:hypothetical protein